MRAQLLAAFTAAVLGSAVGMSSKGIFLASKHAAVLDVDKEGHGFKFADLLGGNIPQSLGSWADVMRQVASGRLPSEQFSEAMKATMDGGSWAYTIDANNVAFESTLRSRGAQETMQRLSQDPELLKKKLQNSSTIQELAKQNPILASLVQKPDALQSLLKGLGNGETFSSSMQKMFALPNRSALHESSDGWLEIHDGLKLKTIRPGDGKRFPKNGDIVSVHYTGYLKDRIQFDSSRDRGLFNFTIGSSEVIQGWDWGVRYMSLGEKVVLQIPSALGYGSTGAGPIPPDADLVFVIMLYNIRASRLA